jgi:hypothetical protein
MTRVVELNAFWKQALAPALPPTGKRGTAAFCLHARTKAMLALARPFGWLVSAFHRAENRFRAA